MVELLHVARIATLVDVRAWPQSRRQPQFSQDALRIGLDDAGVTYHWAGRQLGGRRNPRPDSPHLALRDDAMRGYADHMDSDDFVRAALQLVSLAARAPLAIMCAERLPEHCHRTLIADYLTLAGHEVLHLIDGSGPQVHVLSNIARRESRRLVYDRQVTGSLDL
ncbi:MAG: DUF488 domain-containing protein [Pseudomonadota bacterium]|nr:MAG: DUF488 domain-containing protein [Pseudomonadota bacterium]